jgi:DNA-binding protein HU-beta
LLSETTFELLKIFKNKTMNKSDLIDQIAKDAAITKAQATAAVNSFLDATATSLAKGDSLVLVGFGTFSVTKRAARKGRNPRTKEEINIPAKKVVKFKAGSELSKTVAK